MHQLYTTFDQQECNNITTRHGGTLLQNTNFVGKMSGRIQHKPDSTKTSPAVLHKQLTKIDERKSEKSNNIKTRHLNCKSSNKSLFY